MIAMRKLLATEATASTRKIIDKRCGLVQRPASPGGGNGLGIQYTLATAAPVHAMVMHQSSVSAFSFVNDGLFTSHVS